jgi:multidrug efflux pump subunit AcrA (membrane-fusion protein)
MSDLIIFVDGTSRPLNAAELAHHEATVEKAQAQAEAQAAKQAARQAVLDKLGLTADEAQALLG